VKIAVKHAAAQMAIPHNEVDQLSTSEVEVDVVPEGDAAAMADVVKVAAGEVVTSGLGAEVGDPGRPQWASVDRVCSAAVVPSMRPRIQARTREFSRNPGQSGTPRRPASIAGEDDRVERSPGTRDRRAHRRRRLVGMRAGGAMQ
jgi:hypothetical protein